MPRNSQVEQLLAALSKRQAEVGAEDESIAKKTEGRMSLAAQIIALLVVFAGLIVNYTVTKSNLEFATHEIARLWTDSLDHGKDIQALKVEISKKADRKYTP